MLSENSVPFEYFDITRSMPALKSFLVIRDTSEVFRDVRGKRTIGIPLLVVDDVPYPVNGPAHAVELIDKLHLLADPEEA